MVYQDLRDFLAQLEKQGELKRIGLPISPYLEMTEVCDRVLRAAGPALLFEKGLPMPVLGNLFGTTHRIALAMGVDCQGLKHNDMEETAALRKIGHFLAGLKEPSPPQGWRDAWNHLPMLKQVLNMAPKIVRNPPCQEIIWQGQDVDLSHLPIQHCWPGDVAPLITWGLVVTRGPTQQRQNIGIYRQQVLDRNKIIMRWLPHRGGALDFRDHAQHHPGRPFPIVVVLGCDPATLLSAVMPIPDTLSEYQFAGLLRGAKTELTACYIHSNLQVPARAEIVLEGHIYPDTCSKTGYEQALEGPHGDHTGYYNEAESFPVLTVDCMTFRENPIYLSTYTGRPPDEPAILGRALNDVFVPLLQKQFPEIVDFYLPPEGCSYRLAVVSIKKQYPGHAKRVMFGIWSFLRQFMYTKWIVVVDEGIAVRHWPDVIWAITTCMDPARDTTIIENTPIDYLDFASPISGLGSKIGLDATTKWPGETARTWGNRIEKDPNVVARMDSIWDALGL